VRDSGGTLHAVPEDEVGAEMATLASTTGVFGETAAGVTLGALREAIRAGVVRPTDRVVVLVTGDGLKTPAPVENRFEPVEIAPDADALLESLGVAV
jgi:threonine synthase